MKDKFNHLGLDVSIYQGVSFNDSRISKYHINEHAKRVWSCMYGHLDMIAEFYRSDKDFGIFCEDDILIHKDFNHLLPVVLNDFQYLNLDVLLLGYLLPFKLGGNCSFNNFTKFNLKNNIFEYYSFPDDVWGTQMYVLSKQHAQNLLDKYGEFYAAETLTKETITSFSADWTITKEGKRAAISTLMAIEDNTSQYEHRGQNDFHVACYSSHYISNVYV
jgi:GR25 family glycosyltransferase involved in LPS biosynthesis